MNLYAVSRPLAVSALLLLTSLPVAANKVGKWKEYDRILAIEHFLDAVYPDLRQEHGLLTFRTTEFNLAGGTQYVSFVRCHVGSGVSGGSPRPVIMPNCSGFHESGTSGFLHLEIDLGPRNAPIRNFEAGGTFFGEEFGAFSEWIAKLQPNWGEEETKQVHDQLNQSHPKFGPENHDDFLQTVPAAVIYEFSGCRLSLDQAKFLSNARWYVPGTRGEGKGGYPCDAQFEPFGGKLVSLGGV
jgi:hypothetical protein